MLDVKFPKLGRGRLILLVAVALVLVAVLSNRGGKHPDQAGLDPAGRRACDEFAAGYPRAGTKTARLALADRVTLTAAKSGNDKIRKAATAMGRNADDGGAPWKSSAAALTGACDTARRAG